MGVGHSLCNHVKNTTQRQPYSGISCSSEPIQNVDNSISMYFCRNIQQQNGQ